MRHRQHVCVWRPVYVQVVHGMDLQPSPTVSLLQPLSTRLQANGSVALIASSTEASVGKCSRP